LFAVPSIRYQRPPHTFFTKEEIEKLNRTPFPENPDIRRAALFSIFTGLRWCDYSQLTWRNIQGEYICFTQEKTEESTQLPLNSAAKQILFGESPKVINPDEHVFMLPGYNRCLQLLKIWKRRAGITKKFTTHQGRHTYGHLLASSGFDSYSIQQALGQKTMSSALVYTHLVKEELKQKLDEKLPVFTLNMEAK
jgi:integrase